MDFVTLKIFPILKAYAQRNFRQSHRFTVQRSSNPHQNIIQKKNNVEDTRPSDSLSHNPHSKLTLWRGHSSTQICEHINAKLLGDKSYIAGIKWVGVAQGIQASWNTSINYIYHWLNRGNEIMQTRDRDGEPKTHTHTKEAATEFNKILVSTNGSGTLKGTEA